MIIIYKITDYFPETGQIAVKFCREKSSKPIDDYNAIAIDCKNIETSFPNFTMLMNNLGMSINEKD